MSFYFPSPTDMKATKYYKKIMYYVKRSIAEHFIN